MTAEFDQLVDLTGVSPEDRARLLRVHEMLVAAGPPAELPSVLASAPAEASRAAPRSIAFPKRRRTAAAIMIAAAVAVACFGGGYVLANQAHHGARSTRSASSALQGEQNSLASLKVGAAD